MPCFTSEERAGVAHDERLYHLPAPLSEGGYSWLQGGGYGSREFVCGSMTAMSFAWSFLLLGAWFRPCAAAWSRTHALGQLPTSIANNNMLVKTLAMA